jgi:dTDP-4-dehydrorhamnose reductase
MPETILVTGSTGTLASEIVKQLSAKEETIKTAVRSANDNTFENLKSQYSMKLSKRNCRTTTPGLSIFRRSSVWEKF